MRAVREGLSIAQEVQEEQVGRMVEAEEVDMGQRAREGLQGPDCLRQEPRE